MNNKKQLTKETKILNSLDHETRSKLITPTNDFVFKKIFGTVGNEEILKNFLEAILQRKIKSLELDKDTVLRGDKIDEKTGVLDVRTTLSDGTEIDVEMQNLPVDDTVKRTFFYGYKMYTQKFKSGEYYSNLKQAVVIFILNFELFPKIKNFHTIWKMTEQETLKEKMNNVVFHYIELPKFSNSKINMRDKLDQWLLFIEDSRKFLIEKAIQENEYIKEANENMKKLKRDGYSEYRAWLREKYYIEMNGARAYGYREGVEKGIAQGEIKGIKKEKERTIKNLHKLGYSDEEITKIVKLDIEEVKTILKKIPEKV